MLIGVPRHIILNTIAKNLLSAKVITNDEVDYTKELFSQYDDDELAKSLMESHMLNPINLEQHQVRFISDN